MLYTLNVTNANKTLINQAGVHSTSQGITAVGSTVYLSAYRRLYTLNLTTGATTLLRDDFSPSTVWGMTNYGGKFYFVTDVDLYSVTGSGGTVTNLGSFSTHGAGLEHDGNSLYVLRAVHTGFTSWWKNRTFFKLLICLSIGLYWSCSDAPC